MPLTFTPPENVNKNFPVARVEGFETAGLNDDGDPQLSIRYTLGRLDEEGKYIVGDGPFTACPAPKQVKGLMEAVSSGATNHNVIKKACYAAIQDGLVRSGAAS
jgi:hypothetical protein